MRISGADSSADQYDPAGAGSADGRAQPRSPAGEGSGGGGGMLTALASQVELPQLLARVTGWPAWNAEA